MKSHYQKKFSSLVMALFIFCSVNSYAGVFSTQETPYDEKTIAAPVKDRFVYCKSEIMNSSNLTIHDVIEQKARIDRPCLRSEQPSVVKVENMTPVSYVLNKVAFLQMVYKVTASVSCAGYVEKEEYYLLVSSYLPDASEISCNYESIL